MTTETGYDSTKSAEFYAKRLKSLIESERKVAEVAKAARGSKARRLAQGILAVGGAATAATVAAPKAITDFPSHPAAQVRSVSEASLGDDPMPLIFRARPAVFRGAQPTEEPAAETQVTQPDQPVEEADNGPEQGTNPTPAPTEATPAIPQATATTMITPTAAPTNEATQPAQATQAAPTSTPTAAPLEQASPLELALAAKETELQEKLGVKFATADSLHLLPSGAQELSDTPDHTNLKLEIANILIHALPHECTASLKDSLFKNIAIIQANEILPSQTSETPEPSITATFDPVTGSILVTLPADFPALDQTTTLKRPTGLTYAEELQLAVASAEMLAYLEVMLANPSAPDQVDEWIAAHSDVALTDEMLKMILLTRETPSYERYMALSFGLVSLGGDITELVLQTGFINPTYFDRYADWGPIIEYNERLIRGSGPEG